MGCRERRGAWAREIVSYARRLKPGQSFFVDFLAISG
jgi:hypothetical protein